MKHLSSKMVWILVTGVFLAWPLAGHAELYMKYRSRTDAFQVMGKMQPAEDSTREIWIGTDKVRVDDGEQSTILDMKANTMTILDHTSKTYSVLPQGDFMESVQASMEQAMAEEGETEEGRQAMELVKGMAEGVMGSFKVTVTDTGEKKKIGRWNSTKYLVETNMGVGSSSSEVWASQDIKVDTDLYRAMARALVAEGGGMGEALKEMEKIKGVHVLTISSSDVMGAKVKNTEELLEVDDRSAPDGLYAIPPGYNKEEM